MTGCGGRGHGSVHSPRVHSHFCGSTSEPCEPLPAITPQSRDTRIQVTLGHGQPIATFYKSVHLKVWWGGSTLHPKSWPN